MHLLPHLRSNGRLEPADMRLAQQLFVAKTADAKQKVRSKEYTLTNVFNAADTESRLKKPRDGGSQQVLLATVTVNR